MRWILALVACVLVASAAAKWVNEGARHRKIDHECDPVYTKRDYEQRSKELADMEKTMLPPLTPKTLLHERTVHLLDCYKSLNHERFHGAESKAAVCESAHHAHLSWNLSHHTWAIVTIVLLCICLMEAVIICCILSCATRLKLKGE